MEFYDTYIAKQYYDAEVGSNSNNETDSMKIGLMYVSDYGFAASSEYWTTSLYKYNDKTLRSNNWLYLALAEWTISRFSSVSNVAFIIGASGYVDYGIVTTTRIIRPAFYLNSNVSYVSGDGSQSNPFRIN